MPACAGACPACAVACPAWLPGAHPLPTPMHPAYTPRLRREVQQSLGWTDGMLNWTCFDTYPAFLDALSSGACDVGLAGLAVSKSMLDRNITFAWPVYT